VVHIGDGDTLSVDMQGHLIKIRLFGIELPRVQARGWTGGT
jgi:endonuclease YncB( thermonuclease family)